MIRWWWWSAELSSSGRASIVQTTGTLRWRFREKLKIEKCVWTRKIRYIMRVARLQKKWDVIERNKENMIDFSLKNDEKSSPNVRKMIFATQIYSKSSPGAPFLARCRFSVDFGVPAGTKKWLEIDPGSRLVATLGGSAHFSGFWHNFWWILAPFWVTPGSILELFW